MARRRVSTAPSADTTSLSTVRPFFPPFAFPTAHFSSWCPGTAVYVHAIVGAPVIWTNLTITLDNGAETQTYTNAGETGGFAYNLLIYSAVELEEGIHTVVVMTDSTNPSVVNWIFVDYIMYS